MSKLPKRMGLSIILSMMLLFAAMVAGWILHTAGNVRDVMIPELRAAAAEAAEAYSDVHNDLTEDDENLIYTYQSAMVTNDDGLQGVYPFQSASYLTVGGYVENEVVVRSRNVMLVEIKWLDGTVQKIPMAFAVENSADVAQFLQSTVSTITMEADLAAVTFTGCWEDGLFYLDSIYTPSISAPLYKAPDRVLSEESPESIYVACTYAAGKYGNDMRAEESRQYAYQRTAESISVRSVMKSYGGNTSRVPFADRWNACDQLIDYGRTYDPRIYEDGGVSVRKYGLRETVIQSCTRLSAVGELAEYGPTLCYNYVARFSPLELAVQEVFFSASFYLLLILFAVVTFFLYTMYFYVRNQEQRQLRDEINRQKQALEYAQGAEQSRREMTSAIAHELKTPIAVLSSYAEALQENIDWDKQQHYLSVIRTEADKMDRMVLELLDLSRLEAGKYKLRRENFDMEALTRETIVPLAEQIREKELRLEYQVDDPTVEADPVRMAQIVENFMTNAIRHTPQGGKIVIRIGNDRETFSVENQGSQIPQENLKKVWETFWQGDASRNERGSGLGLAICRSIVELHGGTCSAENTAAGVRFSVSLSQQKKLFQGRGILREKTVELRYPIAQQYTRVEIVFEKLGLLSKEALRREMRDGTVYVGDAPVKDPKIKLYDGYVLCWKEYRITVVQDESRKAQALLFERMRPGGLGNPTSPTGWGGYVRR